MQTEPPTRAIATRVFAEMPAALRRPVATEWPHANKRGLPVVVTGSPRPGGLEELRRHAGGDGPLLLRKIADCAELAAALCRTAAASIAPSAVGGGAASFAQGRRADRTARRGGVGRRGEHGGHRVPARGGPRLTFLFRNL